VTKWPYFSNESTDPPHVWFQGVVFRVGGSKGAISGSIQSKMTTGRHFEKLRMNISLMGYPSHFRETESNFAGIRETVMRTEE